MSVPSFDSWVRALFCGVLLVALPGPCLAQDAERKVIKHVEPKYPEMMRELEIKGTVRLKVTIRPDGTVESVNMQGGNDGLATAAAAAVKQWKFAPGPKTTTEEIKVTFDPDR